MHIPITPFSEQKMHITPILPQKYNLKNPLSTVFHFFFQKKGFFAPKKQSLTTSIT